MTETKTEMGIRSLKGWGVPPKVAQVIRGAAANWNVHGGNILAKDNTYNSVRARRQAAAELMAMGHNASQVGRWLHKHHTSILSMVERHKDDEPPASQRITASEQIAIDYAAACREMDVK